VGNRVVKKKEISLLFEFSFVSGFCLVAEKMKEKKETSDFKCWLCSNLCEEVLFFSLLFGC
jgi:hypothetical protein